MNRHLALAALIILLARGELGDGRRWVACQRLLALFAGFVGVGKSGELSAETSANCCNNPENIREDPI